MPKHKTRFSVTNRELTLAVAFAVMGFAFSTRTFLLWMNELNPFEGLIIYYIILYSSLYVLSKAGLTVFGLKITKVTQQIGLLMITFAFFVTVNFSSAWTTIATGGNPAAVSKIYWGDEDGCLFYLYGLVFPWASAEILRLLTYVVSPAALALIGSYFVSGKVKLGL
jgi:hypothetical protein